MFAVGLLELIVVFVLLVPLSLALLAILDVVRSDFRRDSDRVLWAIIVLLVPVIGPVLYYLVGRRQKLHS
ncbi:MAG: PLD nuclease N-terminal domain-containing protein [bacterium]|nr:PLD nuclease N-terminal domain-containing protein [bacterium]